jgi:hypothetical protein
MLSRPEIGTCAHVKLWIGSKDPEEEYSWLNCDRCVCGQYAKAHGLPPDWTKTRQRSVFSSLNRLARDAIGPSPWLQDFRGTFGSLYNLLCKEGW